MMLNRKKYILGTGAVLILVIMFILRAEFWGAYIQSKINEKIFHKGWTINIGKISGSLIGTTNFEEISFIHNIGTQVKIEKMSINVGYLATLSGELTFDILTIDEMTTHIDNKLGIDSSDSLDINELKIPFHIKSFFVSGKILSIINENPYRLNVMVGGKLKGGDHPILMCDLFSLSLGENPIYGINLRTLSLGLDGSSFYLNKVNGDFFGLPIKGEMTFDYNRSFLSGNVNFTGFTIPEELFESLPLKTKFSSFSGHFVFESDLKYFDGKLNVENDLGLDMSGEFRISKKKTAWILKNLQLNGESSNLTMNGIWENGERVNTTLILSDLDLSRWIIGQNHTQLSGLAILDAGLTKKGTIDQIDLTLEVIESKLFEEGEISIHGQLSYQDSVISTVDPVLVMVGDSYLTIDGEGNFKNNTIDILAELERAEINLVNQFLPGEFLSGQATGRLKIQGDFHSPSVNSELICNEIKVNDFHLESLEFKSEISVSDSLTSGIIDMKAGAGTWRNRNFDSGTINATIRNSEIVIESCHFKSGDDYLQASGEYDGINQYLINQLQVVYQNHFLVNARPVSFSFQDSILNVDPFEFHINDGVFEGVITGGDTPEGRFKMSNFNAGILTQFLQDKRLQVSGIVFGEIWMQWAKSALVVDVDLSLKKGIYMEEAFDEMTQSFLFKNGILHIDDISMTKGESMGFQASGIIPMGKNNVGKTPISLKSNFSQLSLGFIHKFIPNFFTLGGKASGSFHLKGVPEKTLFTYDFDIQNTVFDLIDLGQVSVKGSYDGRRLFVEKAKAIRHDGIIESNGSVPFDFNINSPNIGQFFSGDSIDFHTTAQLESLPFLSPYIADLDSVRGNIDISLSLTGPVDYMERSGHIKVKNAKIYTLLISDPVTSVDGDAYMNHNQLIIQSIQATLYHSNGKYLQPNSQNTTITGAMDFTQFFNPGYNLHVVGNETSFKTLYLDIIGQSNLDLTIVGRDTITIAGKIEALDATVFYEFASEEVGTAISEETGPVMSYQINIPIKGTVLFQNSQIDAIIIGELSLSQIGYQEMDFGGELFVDDGNVFSYKDNFKGLRGYVSFDNKGFNPFIDVSAFTMIDNERINLRINGGIDDLDIALESSSGFSESDILELLTWGKRFEDQELTSTGFGNQTVSILGSLLENQFEKNLKSSEFGKMGLIDDIAISGAAGLLQGTNEDFEVTAKRQIGDKTFLNLSYKRSFSLTNPNRSQIGVEYKLNRHFSVVGNIDEDGNLNLKYRYRYAY